MTKENELLDRRLLCTTSTQKKGGIQEYNDEVGQAYIEAFVKANSDIINEGLAAKARRSRLKVV